MQVRTPVETNRAPHPEHEPYWSFLLRLWYSSLFRPVIRLNARFPWGLKEFSRLYAVAAVYYVIGSVVPIIVIFGSVILALHVAPENVLNLVATADGHPNMNVVLASTVTSFLCGFGAELYYIERQLKKEGLSLWKLIGFNLDSLNGSWTEAVKRAVVALGICLLLQNLLDVFPLPQPSQSTAELASTLDGGALFGFFFLAAVMAPFFEEIIFRGFIFNAFRNVFSEGRIFKILGQSKRMADYAAIGFSSLLFAGAHMEPTAFFQLFVVGVVLAELYRRSGTLVAPMLLHAFNNIVATLIIVLSGKA